MGHRRALPFYYGLAGGGWEGLKAGGLQGGGGLAWTRDTWAPVVMQSAQPEHGPHAAHRAVGVHGVRGCDRPGVLEAAQGEASEPLAALYRQGDGGPDPQ